MADQRSRGGKKQGQDNPQNPEQHQGVEATRSRPEAEKERDATEGRSHAGRPTTEDQSGNR